MNQELLPIRGAPASPYTRKMLAVLRFRRIPYRFIQEDKSAADLPAPKVGLIPVLYLPDDTGALCAEVDSTPIIRRLEVEYPGRSIIPENPVTAFINYLLEDYGDEWLTKAMFHYRWYYQDDIDMAGSILPFYRGGITQPDEQALAAKAMFSERQISRLYVVGSNDITAEVIESSYKRFLGLLNEHFKRFPFLLGTRPSSADFACYGQLTQLTQFDPTPSKIAITQFPRIHAWVSKMEDLSGLDLTDTAFIDEVPETLIAMLAELGKTYVPVMLANAKAIDSGLDTVETTVDAKTWTQEPFPYQAKCLQWLRIEYKRLSEEDQQVVMNVLNGSGCETLF